MTLRTIDSQQTHLPLIDEEQQLAEAAAEAGIGVTAEAAGEIGPRWGFGGGVQRTRAWDTGLQLRKRSLQRPAPLRSAALCSETATSRYAVETWTQGGGRSQTLTPPARIIAAISVGLVTIGAGVLYARLKKWTGDPDAGG